MDDHGGVLHKWRNKNGQHFRLTVNGEVEMWKHGRWGLHFINELCPQIVREFTKLARQAGEP